MGQEWNVVMTNTAKSKCFRLFTERELLDRVGGLKGTLYRKGGSDEYHLLTGSYVAVLAHHEEEDDPDKLVIITQMHRHENYRASDTYEKVDTIEQ